MDFVAILDEPDHPFKGALQPSTRLEQRNLELAISSSNRVLLNFEDSMHSDAILALLSTADHVDIVVAFLKMGGILAVEDALMKHLKAGRTARFIIGSDFYITDPSALLFLLKKSYKYNLDALLVAQSQYSFHPKVYSFYNQYGCKLIVGSANLTTGGIYNNYEASVLFDDYNSAVYGKIKNLIYELQSSGEALPLTDELVADYARRHKIFRSSVDLGAARATRLMSKPTPPLELLEARLIEMKADKEFYGFEQQSIFRARLYDEEVEAFEALMAYNGNQDDFLRCYKLLIGKWTSTGNSRSANRVAQHHKEVIKLLRETQVQIDKESKRTDVFNYLYEQALSVSGLGINAITELLHCMDPENFAVMNQNSVHGLSFGSSFEFPRKPNKMNTDWRIYDRFCVEAERLVRVLSLSSFSELDSLFSYIYFSEESTPAASP